MKAHELIHNHVGMRCETPDGRQGTVHSLNASMSIATNVVLMVALDGETKREAFDYGVLKLADEPRNPMLKGVGSMRISVDDEHETTVSSSTRSTIDPAADIRTIDTALLFVEAIKLRHVDITPEVLYQHLIGCDYAEQREKAGPVLTSTTAPKEDTPC